MDRIKKDFTTITFALIVVALLINIVVGQIVYTVKIPLYLDTMGTVLVGLVAGPWAGALTGLLSSLLWIPRGNAIYAWYWPVGIIIGLLAGYFGGIGWFKTWWKWLLAGLITGFVAALPSAFITARLFGGVTGAGTDVITAMFRAMGLSVEMAALGQSMTVDLVDKVVTFFLVWLIIKGLPVRLLARFPRSENVLEGSDIDLDSVLDA